MKYVKKPIIVEAIQFDEDIFIHDESRYPMVENLKISSIFDSFPIIKTLEGNMVVENGDFIIKGINGEYYPCKPEIFEKTYDKVEEE